MPHVRTLLVAPAVLALAPACAASWEDAPALAAPAAELRQAFDRIPVQAAHGVQELLEENRVVLDAEGRRTIHYRYVFRIDKASALEGWGTVQAGYTLWLDEKPTIRARVITPDGAEHLLDPTTLGDFSPEPSGPDLLSDRRQLKAPLPRLVVGAIAEVEIAYREHRPFAASGTRGGFTFWQSIPVDHYRFRLEAPADARLAWKVLALPGAQVRKEASDGRARLALDLGRQEPGPKPEPNEPPDLHPKPVLYYTTTPNWQAAAADYGRIVADQIRDAGLDAWVREARGPAKERLEVIRRLVERMHKDVRYTGLEFGEASVVPRRPAEVLKRGYGDCKDESAFLVAALAEAGIPAHLALLRAGQGKDLDPDMPGLEVFDHAIVHVPGAPELWIDPTVPGAPVGELPGGDLERRALLVDPRTRDLVLTPGTSPERNFNRETKEVFLAPESGPGRIVETTEAGGPWEAHLRGDYGAADPGKTRENLRGYVERSFKAKELVRMECDRPLDMDHPFRLILEARDAGISATGPVDAAVAVNAWPLVDSLNSVLKEEAQEEGRTTAADAPAPRKNPLVQWAAYATEARWLIHPPLGYAQDGLPPDQTLDLGGATLTLAYRARPDGAVDVDYRLACRRLWTAEEVNKGRAALKAFGETKIPVVVFQQVGEALLAAGKTREALAEFRKLQEGAPDRADPRVRLAKAQLAAGLGERARISAAAAVRLDPKSSAAFRTQGWILQHDELGRRFRKGWDRKGALEAYRKALALDPKDRATRLDLAILLEHDGEGRRYEAPAADLEEAVGLYRALIAEEKKEDIQDNLMVCLGHQGRWAEAKEVALAREPGERRNAWVLGAEACLKGAGAAQALGRSLCQDLAARRAAYRGAADVAAAFRKFPEAAVLLEEGAAGASDRAQVLARAERLARVKPHEADALDPKDPCTAVKRFFLALGTRPLTRETLRGCVSEAVLTPSQIKAAQASQRSFLPTFSQDGMTFDAAMDLTFSLGDFAADGDDAAGYRVQVLLQGQASSWYYVARTGGSYQVVGNELPDLARQARWHLDRGELAQARNWLDKLIENSIEPKADDPMTGNPVRKLWEKGKAAPAEAIRLAILADLAMDSTDPGAVKALLPYLDAPLPPAQQGAVARCLVLGALEHPDKAVLEAASARLLALFPDSREANHLRLESLRETGAYAALVDHVRAVRGRWPWEDYAAPLEINALRRLGRSEEAASLAAERIRKGKATAEEFNNEAWERLASGQVDAKTLEYARRGVQEDPPSRAALHTLATVLAASGRTSEALEYLLKGVAMEDGEDPAGIDWYPMGRIAEHLGEAEAARTYYERVKDAPDGPVPDPTSCAHLARLRLESLAQAARKP